MDKKSVAAVTVASIVATGGIAFAEGLSGPNAAHPQVLRAAVDTEKQHAYSSTMSGYFFGGAPVAAPEPAPTVDPTETPDPIDPDNENVGPWKNYVSVGRLARPYRARDLGYDKRVHFNFNLKMENGTDFYYGVYCNGQRYLASAKDLTSYNGKQNTWAPKPPMEFDFFTPIPDAGHNYLMMMSGNFDPETCRPVVVVDGYEYFEDTPLVAHETSEPDSPSTGEVEAEPVDETSDDEATEPGEDGNQGGGPEEGGDDETTEPGDGGDSATPQPPMVPGFTEMNIVMDVQEDYRAWEGEINLPVGTTYMYGFQCDGRIYEDAVPYHVYSSRTEWYHAALSTGDNCAPYVRVL